MHFLLFLVFKILPFISLFVFYLNTFFSLNQENRVWETYKSSIFQNTVGIHLNMEKDIEKLHSYSLRNPRKASGSSDIKVH